MQCRNSSRCAARSTNDGFRSLLRRVAEERDELAPLNRVPLKLMHRMQHAWRAPRFMMRKSGKPDLGQGGGEGEPLTPHRADAIAIPQGPIQSNSGLLQGLAGRCVAHLRRHLADRRLRHGPGSRCCQRGPKQPQRAIYFGGLLFEAEASAFNAIWFQVRARSISACFCSSDLDSLAERRASLAYCRKLSALDMTHPAGHVAPRDKSYSMGLHVQVKCPLNWAVKFPARIRQDEINDSKIVRPPSRA